MTRFYFSASLLVLYGSVLGQPVVNLGNDTLICGQDNWTFDAGNPGAIYEWSTDETTQTITVYESGTYQVTVTDSTGTTTDEIEISILNEKYNQTNHWIFGTGAYIEFNKHSKNPEGQNGTAVIPAGSSVGTDEDGTMLFYSDGQTIYDRDGNVMENGGNMYGNNNMGSSSLIFPKPGSVVYYYVFTIDAEWGLHYSVVDITANGGKGAVIEKNNLTDRYADMMTSVKPEGADFVWVFVHDRGTNRFRTFKVERNAVTEVAVSETGPEIVGPRHMKVSVYADKLAVTDENGVHFYKVQQTGELKYINSVSVEGASGVEFSQGNNNAYISTENGEIYQVNTNTLYAPMIEYSRVYVSPADTSYHFGDLQLGIDGNIYIASKGKNCIGKITNANSAEPVIQPEGLCLAPGSVSHLEFPDFPQHYFQGNKGMGVRWQDTCQGAEQIISATYYLDTKPYAGIRYHIDLGDGNAIDTNYTRHVYTEPGTYRITVTITSVCHTEEREVPVFIERKPEPLLPDSIWPCANDTVVLDPMTPDSLTYQWDTGEATRTYSPKSSGMYGVTVRSEYCEVRDSTQANFIPLPQPGLKEKDFLCPEKKETVVLESKEGHTFLWMPSGETNRKIVADTAGVYYVFVVGDSSCINEDSILIEEVCEAEVFVPDIFTPNGDNVNDVFLPVGKYVQSYELRIYNRWGEVVFATNDLNEGWDGYYRGSPAQQGAYGYVILYESETRYEKNLKKTAKGHLLLVR